MLLALLAAGSVGAQSALELFQQALVKERSQGRLAEAIALYQRVIKEAGSDRALAAKASLQLAMCYEKLNRPEAKPTYDRIIRDYTDQPDVIASARARLASMTSAARPDSASASAAATATTRVAMFSGTGIVSPDGQWMLIGGGPQQGVRYLQPYRSLYIRHVRTGEVRAVDQAAPAVERMQSFEWSPDSKRVTYNKCYAAAPPDRPTQVCELVVTAIAGGGPQTVYPRSPHFLSPLAWSPDGRSIAVSFYGRTGPGVQSLSLVSISDGSVRDLKLVKDNDLEPDTYPTGTAFTPDGRYLALTQTNQNRLRDIILLATDGSGERTLINHPADDRFVAWTPAGNLLFRSDRSGTIDLWIARVVDGRVEGLPYVVRRDIGSFTPHGLSAQGALYYLAPGMQEMSQGGGAVSFEDLNNDIHLAAIDRTGAVGPPAMINPSHPGRAHAPAFSADGRSLLYRTRDIGTHVWTGFSVLTLETGDARHIRPQGFNNIAPPASWLTPDGRSIVAIGLVPQPGGPNARQLFRVDSSTGGTTTLPGGAITGAAGAQLTNDGRTVVTFRTAGGQGATPAGIVSRDLATGETREVYAAVKGVQLAGLAVSADSTLVACREIVDGKARLIVVTVADGSVREVTPLPTTFQGASRTAWSPDGRFIYFVEKREANSLSEEVWRVASAGGQPHKVLAFDGEILNPVIHPSGRYLAFASQRYGEIREYVLEGFLPPSELIHPAAGVR